MAYDVKEDSTSMVTLAENSTLARRCYSPSVTFMFHIICCIEQFCHVLITLKAAQCSVVVIIESIL